MKSSRLFLPILTAGILLGCIPVTIPPQTPPTPLTPADQQQAYDRDRYQSKIQYNPAAPQGISGFLRLARVYSGRIGSHEVLLKEGSPHDLDAMLDAINEFTEIKAEFSGDIPYGHPGLLDLPIIIPQSEPNEAELEQITRYLISGGFILDINMGFGLYREGLEKYGGLVWGRDAWVESLPEDHPAFFSFFSIPGGLPEVNLTSVPGQPIQAVAKPMQGLFVNDRLAGIVFGALRGSSPLPGTAFGGDDVLPMIDKEIIKERNERRSDPRLRQMMVNIVVFALTQEGSIAQRVVTE